MQLTFAGVLGKVLIAGGDRQGATPGTAAYTGRMRAPFAWLPFRDVPTAGMLLVTLVYSSATEAATLRVPADYLTVQAALAAAQKCDEVLVSDGTWEGVFDVPKGVSLRGEGAVVLDGMGAEEAVYLTHGSSLHNLTIRNARFGVRPHGHWSEIGAVRFEDVETAVVARSSTLWIHDSEVVSASVSGVRVEGDRFWADDLVIRDTPVGLDLAFVRGRLLRVDIEGADTGALVRDSTLSVRESRFAESDLGLFAQGPGVEILATTFDGTSVGAHLLDAPALVLDNAFFGNGYGLRTDYAVVEIAANRFVDSAYASISEGLGAGGFIHHNHFEGGAVGVESLLADPRVWNNDFEEVEVGLFLRGGHPDVRNNLVVGGALCVDAEESPTATVAWNALDCLLDGAGFDAVASQNLVEFDLDYDFDAATVGPTSDLLDAGDPDALHLDTDGSRNDVGRSGGPSAGQAAVAPTPTSPTVAEQAPVESMEGDYAPLFVMNVLEADGDPLILRWDADPSDGYAYCDDWANALEFITPDDGTYEVSVRAEDPAGNHAEAHITITGLNRPPELDPVTTLGDFEEGRAGGLAVFGFDRGPLDTLFVDVDHDGDGLFDVVGAPTGAVGFVPPRSGMFTARIDLRDDDGGMVTESIALAVANAPPMFLDPLPVGVAVGATLEAPLGVADPGVEDTVTVSITEGPDGITWADGTLLWTPDEESVGRHHLVVLAVDQEGAEAEAEGTIEVFGFSDGGCGCAAAPEDGSARNFAWATALLGAASLRRRRVPQGLARARPSRA